MSADYGTNVLMALTSGFFADTKVDCCAPIDLLPPSASRMAAVAPFTNFTCALSALLTSVVAWNDDQVAPNGSLPVPPHVRPSMSERITQEIVRPP